MTEINLLKWSRGEALFTAGVVGLLVIISGGQLKLSQMKSRDAQRKADAEMIARTVAALRMDYKKIPEEDNGQIKACGNGGVESCDWGGGPVVDAENVTYLKNIPRDPLWETGRKYVYKPLTEGRFRIYAALENRRDEQYKSNLTVGCGNGLQCNWYVEN